MEGGREGGRERESHTRSHTGVDMQGGVEVIPKRRRGGSAWMWQCFCGCVIAVVAVVAVVVEGRVSRKGRVSQKALEDVCEVGVGRKVAEGA